MNIEYLYSIISLYLKNEKDGRRTNLMMRLSDQDIEFNFNMNNQDPNKTVFKLPYDIVNEVIVDVLRKYKLNEMIIDENFKENNGNCYYQVLLQNGRMLTFSGFSFLEINNFRNILYDIHTSNDEILLSSVGKKREMAYSPSLKLQRAGFISYATLFLIALFLTDVFVIALWIFKVLTK